MKTTLLTLILFLTTSTFAVNQKKNRFDSATNIGLEGTIESGEILTSQTEAFYTEREIRNQLSFLVGALNGWGGTFDLDRAEIKVGAKNESTGRTSYSAKVFISWPRNMSTPQIVGFPIPLRGDYQGIQDYYNRYSKQCSENGSSSELDVTSFFYYHRPQNGGCPASKPAMKPENVFFPQIKVGVSNQNTNGKSPEYGKIWEDGELTVTIITGTNEPGATSNGDIGISEYNSMYRNFWRMFGNPSSMNVQLGPNNLPGMQNPDIEMHWLYGDKRKLNIAMLLIDKYQLQGPTSAFKQRLQKRIEDSDYITYNGHSGLGSNIRALVKLGKYKTGKYQVFFFNGCDTFSYVDNSLAEMHKAVNPEASGYKYVDFISNSMPSPFSGFLQNNSVVISALFNSNRTYRQILSQFDSYQRAVVMGEEDNNWPKPFLP